MLVVPRYRYSCHEQPAAAAYRSAASVNPLTKKFRCSATLSQSATRLPTEGSARAPVCAAGRIQFMDEGFSGVARTWSDGASWILRLRPH